MFIFVTCLNLISNMSKTTAKTFMALMQIDMLIRSIQDFPTQGDFTSAFL